MAEIWGAVAAAVVGAGTAVYSTQQQKKAANKALDAQRGIAADIKYEPIDLERLKATAAQAAVENAVTSLQLERDLTPDIAATRAELARQVSSELAMGGRLPADTVNQVTMAGRTIGARSGIGEGSTTPLTAALLGLSSIDLANQRRAQAANLLGDNPLPVTGLDPGSIASLEVANNAANNQFNLEKAGVASNLAESELAARSAQIAGQVGNVSTLTNLLGDVSKAYANRPTTTNYEDALKKVPKTATNYLNQNPSTNPVMGTGLLA